MQRGYQDSGGERERGRRGPGGPVPRPAGPRGRGLGRPTTEVCRCAVCGSEQDVSTLEPGSRCSKCNADLHTCTHCAHFDSSATFECRQPITARIASKAKANDCELFAPRATKETAGGEMSSDPKAAFDALFKGL